MDVRGGRHGADSSSAGWWCGWYPFGNQRIHDVLQYDGAEGTTISEYSESRQYTLSIRCKSHGNSIEELTMRSEFMFIKIKMIQLLYFPSLVCESSEQNNRSLNHRSI